MHVDSCVTSFLQVSQGIRGPVNFQTRFGFATFYIQRGLGHEWMIGAKHERLVMSRQGQGNHILK